MGKQRREYYFMTHLMWTCKDPPPPIPYDLCMFMIMMIFRFIYKAFPYMYLRMGKAHGLGTFPKCGAGLSCCLLLGPIFWECSHCCGFTYTKRPHSRRWRYQCRYWIKTNTAAKSPRYEQSLMTTLQRDEAALTTQLSLGPFSNKRHDVKYWYLIW
jgi:hypothetical protein